MYKRENVDFPPALALRRYFVSVRNDFLCNLLLIFELIVKRELDLRYVRGNVPDLFHLILLPSIGLKNNCFKISTIGYR